MNGDGARGNGAVARENFESKVYHFIGDRLHDICACGNARRKVPSFNFFSKTLVTVRPKITLLGDSITQRAFLPGQWGARLAAHYDRTADVELRGYAGYNSAWIKAVVPTLLAHPVAPALVVVQMGTNDSVHPAPVRGYDKTASRQHVPIAAYKANLTEIIRLIRECGDGSTRILLMTPPPIADERRMQFEGTDILCEDGRERGVLWSDATVEQYVVACQHVARKERIPILNLYAEFKQTTGWHDLLNSDGTHPNANGGELIGRLVIDAIAQNFPDLRPARPEMWRESTPDGRLPLDFPDHKAMDPSDTTTSIEAHRDTIERSSWGIWSPPQWWSKGARGDSPSANGVLSNGGKKADAIGSREEERAHSSEDDLGYFGF